MGEGTKNSTPVGANTEELTAEQLKAILDEQSKQMDMLMEQLNEKGKESTQDGESKGSTETDPKDESGKSETKKFLGIFSKKEKPEYQKMSDAEWFNNPHPSMTPAEIDKESRRRRLIKAGKVLGIIGIGIGGFMLGKKGMTESNVEDEQLMLADMSGDDVPYETYESPNVVDVETMVDEF